MLANCIEGLKGVLNGCCKPVGHWNDSAGSQNQAPAGLGLAETLQDHTVSGCLLTNVAISAACVTAAHALGAVWRVVQRKLRVTYEMVRAS